MLSISNLTYEINEKLLFSDVNLSATAGDKIALIGDNGSGKTTLLQLIMGEIIPDNGAIKVVGNVEFVEQENNFPGSVREFFIDEEAWRVQMSLDEVALSDIDFDAKVSNLSGGQKTRLSLAKVLSHEDPPNVLLLDEPTNNLDAAGQKWLTDFMNKFRGTVIFTSHDREFIDIAATEIWEIADKSMRTFSGNYSFYKRQKELERQRQMSDYEKYKLGEKKLLRIEKIAKDKNRAVSHSRFDKLHMAKKFGNDKMNFNTKRDESQSIQGAKIRAIQSKLDQLERVEKPHTRKTYRANLHSEITHDKVILRAEKLSKSFNKKIIFKDLNFEIRTGERLRILGDNGSGKTTLLKICAGIISPDQGEVWRAPNLKIGYLSQDVLNLDLEKVAIENLRVEFGDLAEIFAKAAAMDLDRRDLAKLSKNLSRGQLTKLGV